MDCYTSGPTDHIDSEARIQSTFSINLSLRSQHHNTHPTHLTSIHRVIRINAPTQRFGAPIEQVIVQPPIPRLELLLLQEQWIVEKCDGVEDMEIVLLGHDQDVVHEGLETGGEVFLDLFGFGFRTGRGWKGGVGGVVVEVGGAYGFLLVGFEDSGLVRRQSHYGRYF